MSAINVIWSMRPNSAPAPVFPMSMTWAIWEPFPLTAQVAYRSKTYLTVSSSEILAQNGYALVDASIRYTSADQLWDVVLSGQNLTNKKYREHGFDLSAFPGVELGYYGTPRTYNLTVRYSF